MYVLYVCMYVCTEFLTFMVLIYNRYLDKMYSLSSAEALKEFIRNPRPYLLPPLPKTPCKICVLGPPTSGKSTLAKQLAEHYDAMVSIYVCF